MTLSKFEQETIITFNAEEKTAEIYTADPVQIRRLDSLCTEFPDTYKLKKQGEISKTFNRKDRCGQLHSNWLLAKPKVVTIPFPKNISLSASRELSPNSSVKGLSKI